MIENLSKADAVKEKVIHLHQLEFLPIFPYSELLIWILSVPNVTYHSYFDSVYLKIFTALSFLAGGGRVVRWSWVNFQCRLHGASYNFDHSRARAYCACSRWGGGGCWTFFPILSLLFLPSLGDGPI